MTGTTPSPSRSLVDRLPETHEPWYPDYDRYLREYEDLFDIGSRSTQTVTQAHLYGRGLLSTEGRKSMQPLAHRMGTAYHRTQHFITDSPWSPEVVQTRHAQLMARRFASKEGLFALDDEGDPKKGTHSAGVARQWCGNRGKEENCQVGVCLSYVRPHPTRYADMVGFGVGMRLYLRQEDAENEGHRKETHIPKDVEYAPKWKIGLDLLDRVRPLHIPHRAVTADADYGRSGDFRKALRDRKEAYVLGVQPTHTRILEEGGKAGKPRSCAEVARGLPAKMWRHLKWAEGTKGALTMEVARIRARVWEEGKETDEEVWVLFERRENETKAYLIWGLDEVSLRNHVRMVRGRWGIELWFEQAKGVLGLDQFEGRTWPGWHHNVTMVMLSYGFLMTQRADGKEAKFLPTLPSVQRATERRVVAELGDRVIGDTEKDRRERFFITALEVMGRPPKLTADGHLFVSKDWRDYLDEG